MIYGIILLVISSGLYTGVVQAQSSTNPNDQDSANERTEASEDAHRRRMELEGARDRSTFSNTTFSTQTGQEKIDKLPEKSRRNIREQLTDMIIENGQWEPFDALREYPYEPSEAAQEDPGLREREEEAWAEQMEKYHQREASAFEAARPSMPGTDSQQAGTSPGQQGDEQSEQSQSQDGAEGEGEQQGDNQGGEDESQGKAEQQSSQGSSANSASSYDPYQSQQNDDANEVSTAGVSESALDFLRSRQEQGSGSTGQPADPEAAMESQEAFDSATDSAKNGSATTQQSDQGSQPSSETEFIIPGTIAIKDLDKLEGMTESEENDADQL